MENGTIKELDLSKIHLSADNPRKNVKDPDLQELQKSITQHGVLQPILVRAQNGSYELIAGARRLAASEAAGLKSIPAKIIDRYGSDVSRRVANRRQLQVPKHSWGNPNFSGAVEKLAKAASVPQLRGLLVELIAQHDVPQSYSGGYGTHLKELAKLYKVDLPAIERQIAKEKPEKKTKTRAK